MNKSSPLQPVEIESKLESFNPLILQLIEKSRNRFNVTKNNFRILDFGCGRGRNVAALLHMGYDAFGVDVDPVVLTSARHGIPDGKNHLFLINQNNETPFENLTFHFIMTEHVLEHVQSLSTLTSEFKRILKSGGYIYNVYPPIGRFIEPHIKMPFIHYFGDNKFRKLLIRTFVLLGFHARWEHEDTTKLVEVYSNYLNQKVNHKSNKLIKNTFGNFCDCTFITEENEKVLSKLNSVIPSQSLVKFACRHIIPNFYIAHLLCIKK